ncbi:MAG: hemolysin III family protein [Oscillospiraceae bacterium]|nr:hemolysin III family protein [Oscillospiraceae bacterium]
MAERKNKEISIPSYSLGEELFNAISHGLGALLSIAALVLMLIRARNALEVTTAAIFGTSMIFLYTISCVYHALSPGLRGKKVLRVLDHCSVFLLVFGTYIPASLLGVSGVRGWLLFGLVAFFTALGIVFTALDLERYQLAAVICQLLSGWSILMGVSNLRAALGLQGLIWMIAGGVMYSIGAILYGIGKNRKYCHSVFHVFCLLGTFCHFWAIYEYLL